MSFGIEVGVEAATQTACLSGVVSLGFSLLVTGGGSVDDLAACAQGRRIGALYALHGGEYVPYILGAPDFANARFRDLYREGVPALTPLVAQSEGPASPDPAGAIAPVEPWPHCLRGESGEGFSLLIFAGGSAGDLHVCAEERGITALYTLQSGTWISYILGAPDFVNAAFLRLFDGELHQATPLLAQRASPADDVAAR